MLTESTQKQPRQRKGKAMPEMAKKRMVMIVHVCAELMSAVSDLPGGTEALAVSC